MKSLLLILGLTLGTLSADPMAKQIELGSMNVALLPISSAPVESMAGIDIPDEARRWGIIASLSTQDVEVAAFHVYMNILLEDGTSWVVDRVVEKRPAGERTCMTIWLGSTRPISYRKVIITRLY